MIAFVMCYAPGSGRQGLGSAPPKVAVVATKAGRKGRYFIFVSINSLSMSQCIM